MNDIENNEKIANIENNEKTAKSFPHLNYCDDNQNYGTMSNTKKLLDIPYLTTDFYGTTQQNAVTSLTETTSKKHST